MNPLPPQLFAPPGVSVAAATQAALNQIPEAIRRKITGEDQSLITAPEIQTLRPILNALDIGQINLLATRYRRFGTICDRCFTPPPPLSPQANADLQRALAETRIRFEANRNRYLQMKEENRLPALPPDPEIRFIVVNETAVQFARTMAEALMIGGNGCYATRLDGQPGRM